MKRIINKFTASALLGIALCVQAKDTPATHPVAHQEESPVARQLARVRAYIRLALEQGEEVANTAFPDLAGRVRVPDVRVVIPDQNQGQN
jgi:hypothetical protein